MTTETTEREKDEQVDRLIDAVAKKAATLAVSIASDFSDAVQQGAQTDAENAIDALHEHIAELRNEVSKLRGALEWDASQVWEFGLSDIDGGDWQDEMERRGLLVKVPASKDIREQYDTDEMMTLVWSQDARRAHDTQAGGQ